MRPATLEATEAELPKIFQGQAPVRLMEPEPERALPAVRQNHPHPTQLEHFLRGELPRPEVASIVRHLLTGCPVCLQETCQLWELGERTR